MERTVSLLIFLHALAAALVEYERYAVWSRQDNHGDTQGLELEFSHAPRIRAVTVALACTSPLRRKCQLPLASWYATLAHFSHHGPFVSRIWSVLCLLCFVLLLSMNLTTDWTDLSFVSAFLFSILQKAYHNGLHACIWACSPLTASFTDIHL